MTNTASRSRGVPVTTAVTGPSLLWRFVASLWLVFLLFPAGALAWLGFGILAVVSRRRSWMIIAVSYGVAAIVVQLRVDAVGEIVQGTLYLVALVHGLFLNQRWLLLLWSRNENQLTVFGNPVGAKASTTPATRQREAPVPREAQKLLGAEGTSRSDYVADAPPPAGRRRRLTRAERRAQTEKRTSAASTSTAPTDSTMAEPAPASETELIDVNTANQRTLARLTGIDRGLAKTLLADRTKRGGFGSLDDFAATAGLQPHQLVRLRGEAFCSPRPRSARSFGRRVDY
jgi:hypothetical protein